ncbi:MAG: M14 family metallocarboxypeptidase [Myxococcaceae bacterium]|nr:M14 family metallocarboxypeptidase [Myxococcaceae bacterium]
MKPWGPQEKQQWFAAQTRKRSYADDVSRAVDRFRDRFDVEQYGELPYAGAKHPLWAVRTRGWDERRPVALITGGVHGYETSGVHGALQFIDAQASRYAGRLNVLVLPCISPWAYEHIHRWNPEAVDPNRSFREGTSVAETAPVLRLIAPLRGRFVVHVDLHETTDSDESEFRPALAARDGKEYVPGEIPDGFYVVADTANPQLEFQRALIDAVSRVTHIAPPDAKNQIIGSAVVSPGVIEYDVKSLGLCAGITSARYTTTTEVYPDSPRASPAQCNAAQVSAVCAALDFALAHGG